MARLAATNDCQLWVHALGHRLHENSFAPPHRANRVDFDAVKPQLYGPQRRKSGIASISISEMQGNDVEDSLIIRIESGPVV